MTVELGKAFKACVITGRAIQESEYYMCKTCRHQLLQHERSQNQSTGGGPPSPLQNCPLCHSPLIATGR
jgi:transcription initiation factor IIE alpha subunit